MNWIALCINHSDTFDEWFDKDLYNWQDSYYLAQFCSNHFDKWFDKDKYNWFYSYSLANYCSEHIVKWYPYYPNKEELELTPIQIAKLRNAGLI